MLIYIYRPSLRSSVPESGGRSVGGSTAHGSPSSLIGFAGAAQVYTEICPTEVLLFSEIAARREHPAEGRGLRFGERHFGDALSRGAMLGMDLTALNTWKPF